ncbi:LacI family DNA-binding transcriptional regulator [Roseovarius sp. CH_XMU1461]|uniref:LacI family DNA-binding transcriptional regulator n=1 Tax=Roseovarius sp. CH_XMU1461 TaxID=3107777 RepID=UPI003009D7C7
MTAVPPNPTLEDVARMAGVSTATVSRCLNAPDKVVERTRVRVLEAVRELGYLPNFGARAMVARRTNTIGAIIPTMANAIFARGLQAFQEEARRLGYQLLVASSSYRADLEEEQARALAARGADGLLLIGLERAETLTAFLAQRGLPAVVAWTYGAEAALPTVGFDNRAAMRGLAGEVLRLGHRRVAMISAPVAHNDRARARLEGLRDALGAAGLDTGSDTGSGTGLRVIETRYGLDEGGAALARLMQGETPPTAVLCGNDVLAAGAIRQARALGLRVPEDVSITGFDDLELATLVTPALTTVHVPHQEMGRLAARCLVEMVEQSARPRPAPLATELRLRDSLGPPPVV